MSDINEETNIEEMVTFFDKYGNALLLADEELAKIQNESEILFDRKVIAIKNKLAENTEVKDEDLHKVFVEELEKARKEVVEDAENRIKTLLEKNGVKGEGV